jgi:F-type H+/Na+-transporting ATPase subunit beta
VRGSVVDVRFDRSICRQSIRCCARGAEGKSIAIEVLAQLDAHRVRGIALTPTQGLAAAWRWRTRAGR